MVVGSAEILRSADTSLIEFGLGVNAYAARDYKGAAAHLRAAGKLPKLADYLAYYLASSEQQNQNFDAAAAALAAYRETPVASSPLAGKIGVLEARVLLDKRNPADSSHALAILQKDGKLLPQPDGDFALGLAYEAQGEKEQAALAYERVYYGYPNTDLAAQSWNAMERLRAALGKDFATPGVRQQLDRCERWLDARQYHKAREEYTSLASTLSGVEKEQAKIGIGVSFYMGGDNAGAFHALKDAATKDGELDARRLYYLEESARKLSDDAAMADAVAQLDEHHAESQWRLKALIAAGNRYVVTNDTAKYTPLFQAASKDFPADTTTAYAHWKLVWDAYLAGKPDRVPLLKEQIERYSGDSRAGTAMYFMGRLAENDGEFGEAHSSHDRLSAHSTLTSSTAFSRETG